MKLSFQPGKSLAAERLEVIRGAIQEIQSRPDLGQAAKERGIRALKKAEARIWHELEQARQAGNGKSAD